MTLSGGNSLRSIVNNDEMYKRFVNYWDDKIKAHLINLEHQHDDLMSDENNDVLIDRNSILDIVKDTLQTKSIIDTKAEYIRNLITELEDNQIIKEYQVELRSLNANLAIKEMEIQALNKEKEDLKREITQTKKYDYTPEINNINRTLEKIRMDTSQYQNKVELERYKIVADNCMSESDRSVSEEDSLEHKTDKKLFRNNRTVLSKTDPFHLSVDNAISSTPKKKSSTESNVLSESFHKALKSTELNPVNISTEIDQNACFSGWDASNNLIDDHNGDLNEYSEQKNYENVLHHSKIENWELTNTSIADEYLNENYSESEKDKVSLKQLMDNVENLYNKLYEVPPSEIAVNGSGDQPDSREEVWKKLEKIHKKLYENDDRATSTQSLCEFDVMKERFQKFSEISVKLICQILNCISEYTGFNNESDFTILVTSYLEKLMSDPSGDCSAEFNLSDVKAQILESFDHFKFSLAPNTDITNDVKIQMENLNKYWNKRVQAEQLKTEEYEQLFKDKEAEMTELKQQIELEVKQYKLNIQELERKLRQETKFNQQQTEIWEDERNKHRDEVDRLNKSFEVVSHQSRKELEDKDREFQLRLSSSSLIRHSSLGCIRRSKESQTDHKSYLEINENLNLKDLERVPEITPIIEKLRMGQSVCLNAFYLILDNLVTFGSKLRTNEYLVRLKELQGKTITEIENYSPTFWASISNDIDEIYKVINNFISEGVEVRKENLELLENVEIHKSRARTKLDEIQRLEIENQQLLDYQNGLQSEHSYLLSMNEDQQRKLEEMTHQLLKLEQENKSIEQQIFNEKEEDIYILKEDKENLEKSYQTLQEDLEKVNSQLKLQVESHQLEIHELNNKTSHIQLNFDESQEKLIYYEKIAKDRQKIISDYKRQLDDRLFEIDEIKLCKVSLEEEKNSLKLELSLSNVRLHELQKQNEKEMTKVKRCWQDAEDLLKNTSKEINDAESQTVCDRSVSDAEIQTDLNIQDDVKSTSSDSQNSQRFSSLIKEIQLDLLSTERISEDELSESRRTSAQGSNVTTPRSFTFNEKQITEKTFITCETQTIEECPPSENKENDTIIEKTSITCETQTIEEYPPSENKKNKQVPEKTFNTCEIQTVEEYPEVPNLDLVAFEEELRSQFQSSINELTIKNENIDKVNKELTEKSEFLLKELKNNEEQRDLYRKTLEETDAKHQNVREQLNNTCRKLNQLTEAKQELEINHEREINELEQVFEMQKTKQKTLETDLELASENSLKNKAESDKHLATIRSLQTMIARKNEESTNDVVELHKKNSEKTNQLKILQQKYNEKCDELENLKKNMIETIQSNESYREQIQENLLKYQDRRFKMETELYNSNKALRQSYHREVSFHSQLESMRLEYHKVVAENKELEKKLGRTEKCLCKWNKEHDKDRMVWMNSLGNAPISNGEGSSAENDSDDLDCEVRLEEISYILRKLVFKMELFDDHLKINHGFSRSSQATSCNTRFSQHDECSIELDSKLCTGEMAMLRKSIDNLLSMINIYMRSLNSKGCSIVNSTVKKSNYVHTRPNNRPKPMGSSNSFESSDNNDQLSSPDDNYIYNNELAANPQHNSQKPPARPTTPDEIQQLKTRVRSLMNQNQQQKRTNDNMFSQKQLVASLLSPDMQIALFTSKLTPKQKDYYNQCNRKFMFRSFVRAVIARNRFQKFISMRHTPIHSNSLNYNSQFPLPKFSTSTPKKFDRSRPDSCTPSFHNDTYHRLALLPSNRTLEMSSIQFTHEPQYSYEEPTRDHTLRIANVRSTHPQSANHNSALPPRRSSLNTGNGNLSNSHPSNIYRSNSHYSSNGHTNSYPSNDYLCNGDPSNHQDYGHSKYRTQPQRSVSFSLTNHSNPMSNRRNLSRTVAQVDKFENMLDQIYSTDKHYRR